MLTRIQLKNFKLHADTSIDAAPITVFIGPNSSGKSSIFQCLLLWRQAAARNLQDFCTPVLRHVPAGGPYLFPDDQLIDIGEFSQVVRHGQREILLSLSGDIPPRKMLEYGPGATRAEMEVRIRDNRLVYQMGRLHYELGSLDTKGIVSWSWPHLKPPLAAEPTISIQDMSARLKPQPSMTFSLLGGTALTFTRQFSPAEHISLQELGQQIQDAPRALLESAHPVFALRGFEEAGYPFADAPAISLDRMALQDRTIALLSVLAYNRAVEKQISDWLADLAGIRIEIQQLPGKRVTILCAPSSGEATGSLFSNEGTGANQLPFILVPIGLTPQGETVLLSEPEAHLHPRAQSHLTRLLVRLLKTERRQFFIETHSEHVLHALLNSIANREISLSDLAIYYFENQEGKSVASRLNIDESGGVVGGLPGFFDQSLGELTEYLGALKTK